MPFSLPLFFPVPCNLISFLSTLFTYNKTLVLQSIDFLTKHILRRNRPVAIKLIFRTPFKIRRNVVPSVSVFQPSCFLVIK